jgi:hypothetical protein
VASATLEKRKWHGEAHFGTIGCKTPLSPPDLPQYRLLRADRRSEESHDRIADVLVTRPPYWAMIASPRA